MDLQEKINNQFNYYRRGLLTWSEALENIEKMIDDEKYRRIECRKGRGKWKTFSDKLYSKEEAADVLESLNYCSLGYEFRAIIA